MLTLELDDGECRIIREALLSECRDDGVPNAYERLLDRIDGIAGTKTVSKFHSAAMEEKT